jgi:uncharacterized protein
MMSPVKIWRNQKQITNQMGKEGIILSWTIIRVPPSDFSDQAPYPVAVVKLDDGKIITVQVVDMVDSSLSMGQRVVTVIRRIRKPSDDGVIPYGIKVKPL